MVTSHLAYRIETPVEENIVAHESPVKYCSVALSDVIARGKRLEASVFDVEAMQAYDLLIHGRYPVLDLIGKEGPVLRAYYGGRMKRHYVEKNEKNAVGFLGSSEMLDCQPKPVKFMRDDARAKEAHVKQGMILLSRSGTIGNVTYIGKTLSKYLVSEHAIRIECKEFSGYVYAFLKSKVGKLAVSSTQYGAVIQEIEPEHLAGIPIPNAPAMLKSRIHYLIERSYALRDASNDLIDEATALLAEALNLPPMDDIVPKLYEKDAEVDTFSVPLRRLAGRLEASYHVPVVDVVMEYLEQNADEVTTIGDPRISREVILPGRFKRVYVDEGHGRVFIGGKQLYELDPTNKKYLSNVHHGVRISKQLELHENMTLVTCSGTIGKVTLVPKHWENWAANQHIIRIVPTSDDMAGYLYIFLASDYGQPLIRRFTYGSVVDEIDDHHVRRIAVPLLKDRAAQQKINDLALAANEKRYEAYCLEQDALKMLNEQIIFAK